jgi:hypothetical protein
MKSISNRINFIILSTFVHDFFCEYWDFVLIDGFCSYNTVYIFLRIACVTKIFNMRSVLLSEFQKYLISNRLSGSPYKTVQVNNLNQLHIMASGSTW